MAKKIRNPIFAHGRKDSIINLIRTGEIKYPAYLWYTDNNTYNFLNKNGQIECIDFPKLTGTLDEEVVLSELNDGIYYVKGQYSIIHGVDPTFLSPSYIIAIIANNGNQVRRITASDFDDYTIENGQIISHSSILTSDYLIEHHYVTEDYVDEKIAVLEETLKDEVVAIIEDELADLVSEEIDKQIETIPQEDIEDLFSNEEE